MRSHILCLSLLLTGVSSASAQTVDKAKLRDAVCLPDMDRQYWFFVKGMEDLDPAQELESLQKRLDGSTSDAKTYLDIASCYRRLGDKARRTEAVRKAGAILEPYLESTRPKDVPWLAVYAHQRLALDSPDLKAARHFATRACELAPDDWLNWQAALTVSMKDYLKVVYGARHAAPPLGRLG